MKEVGLFLSGASFIIGVESGNSVMTIVCAFLFTYWLVQPKGKK